MKLRLDKYLADMGIGTRTEVKKAITKGQVRVNEETVNVRRSRLTQKEIMCFTRDRRLLMQNMNITC